MENKQHIYILSFGDANIYHGIIDEDDTAEDYLSKHNFKEDEVHYLITDNELALIDLD